MSLPAGMHTTTLTFGSSLAFDGEDIAVTATVTPTHHLTWEATGQPLVAFPIVRDAIPGMPGQIVVPSVNQPGFVDPQGRPFQRWAYQVELEWTAVRGGKKYRRTEMKSVQPLVGQATVPLDLVPVGSISTPVVAPVLSVTSVNGQTGAVTVEAPDVDAAVPAEPDTIVRRDAAGAVVVAEPTAPTHAATRAFAERLPAVINARAMFGAAGDATTDDSDALLDAIAHSLTRRKNVRNQNPRILIPAGHYRIHRNALFSGLDFLGLDLTSSTRDGLVFVGEGRRATVLELITDGTEKWFYDNGSISTQKYERLFFEHIGFRTDNPELGNGFRQFSQGGEKQFKFFDCDFNLGTVLQCEGTGNADLNRFLLCYIEAARSVLTLNNGQSVANEFISCDMTIRRSLVKTLANGGGSTNFIGGNFEMQQHPSDTTDHYLVDIPQQASMTGSNATTTIADVRFEIHGANKKLVRTVGTTTPANINFSRCSFGTVADGPREVVTITATKRVLFDNCLLHDNFTYRADAAFAGSPSGAQLMFDRCDVGLGTPLASRCTATGNAARIVATGCYRSTSSTTAVPIIAEDFDLGWRSASPRGVAAQPKVVAIKPVAAALPVPGAAVSALPRVQLPAGAWVKRIVVKKAPHSGASTSEAYQLHVGSADQATTLGSSTLGTWGGAHAIDLPDPGVLPFDTIAIWATGGTIPGYSGGAGTVAYVEYI